MGVSCEVKAQDPYKTTVARWRSRVATCSSPPSPPIRQILPAPPGLPRRLVILVLPCQPIPIGRPYRSQPNGVLTMLTARKGIVSLPTHRLASRYLSDSSSSDCSSRHSSSVSPVRRALSPVRTDLSPLPKRIRDSDSVTKLEVSLEDDIDECVAYADAIRARGMNYRDVVETVAEEEVESRERDTVEVEVDPKVDPVIEDDVRESVREDVLDHGHRIARVDLEVTTMTERIDAFERDNTRVKGMLDVESQRVDRIQRGLSRA
ncbi:hypothetical protein Tco_1144918 [Tanacetum coccineum]